MTATAHLYLSILLASDPERAPALVWILLGMPGVLYIAFGIPMARRRVPPNHSYGLRTSATLADADVWYESNAQAGRHSIVFGAFFLVLLAGLRLFTRLDDLIQVGILLGVLTVVGIGDALFVAIAAQRLLTAKLGRFPITARASKLTAKDIVVLEAIGAVAGLAFYIVVGPGGHRLAASVFFALTIPTMGILYAIWRIRRRQSGAP